MYNKYKQIIPRLGELNRYQYEWLRDRHREVRKKRILRKHIFALLHASIITGKHNMGLSVRHGEDQKALQY